MLVRMFIVYWKLASAICSLKLMHFVCFYVLCCRHFDELNLSGIRCYAIIAIEECVAEMYI